MGRIRYMLDTNAVIYFINESSALPNHIKDDIHYNFNDFYISILSIVEIVNKVQSGKLFLTKITSFKDLIEKLEENSIEILSYSTNELFGLYDMPYLKEHSDPIDRAIFSHAIAKHCRLITSDKKFILYPAYKDYLLPI
jgi:PIN domain nuclease of toxin-antitoxin system